jgi:hypothetical protein
MHRMLANGKEERVTPDQVVVGGQEGLLAPMVPSRPVFGQSYVQLGPYASDRLRKFLRIDVAGADIAGPDPVAMPADTPLPPGTAQQQQ